MYTNRQIHLTQTITMRNNSGQRLGSARETTAVEAGLSFFEGLEM